VKEALGLLKTARYDILICQYPIALLETLLANSKILDNTMKIIIIADSAKEFPAVYANAILFNPTSAEILDYVKIFAVRKRGPHQGWKKSVTPETLIAQKMEVVA
jgi:hypothetical protein